MFIRSLADFNGVAPWVCDGGLVGTATVAAQGALVVDQVIEVGLWLATDGDFHMAKNKLQRRSGLNCVRFEKKMFLAGSSSGLHPVLRHRAWTSSRPISRSPRGLGRHPPCDLGDDRRACAASPPGATPWSGYDVTFLRDGHRR